MNTFPCEFGFYRGFRYPGRGKAVHCRGFYGIQGWDLAREFLPVTGDGRKTWAFPAGAGKTPLLLIPGWFWWVGFVLFGGLCFSVLLTGPGLPLRIFCRRLLPGVRFY